MGDLAKRPSTELSERIAGPTTVDLFALARDANEGLSKLMKRGGGGFSVDLQEFRDKLASMEDRLKTLELERMPDGHWMADEVRRLHDKLRFASIREERVERAISMIERATGCKITTDSQGNVKVALPSGDTALLPTGYTGHLDRKQLGK